MTLDKLQPHSKGAKPFKGRDWQDFFKDLTGLCKLYASDQFCATNKYRRTKTCLVGLGWNCFFCLDLFDMCLLQKYWLLMLKVPVWLPTVGYLSSGHSQAYVPFLLYRLRTQRRRLFSSGIRTVLGLTLMRCLICRRENVTSVFPGYSIIYWLEMTASAWHAIGLPGRALNQVSWFLCTILRKGIFATLQLAGE